ncbi:hypothetical protein A3B40_01060 [Candidatus Roizmanbacteria bacterium RIFCSPLOWO2_01_FULL_37_16]|uniref:Uncharacterized protein n=1 Tax=Candidatus Roizmanbacteria bacterium RIFCSPLOWO2_01_FULL_37_16 TaxID=1802058 RepID=A0A1F7IJ26_9BACT|nr:MAG: hypothetical protein A2859_01185 [Candidatus Roizmanbacteria bacterium RIFCSPHIGHO2_01_FULL_37_16b]OGK33100.1 MAG: hypothetical protein A3F57_06020 [Candidatus Roizmanbacteria bacterium RIFCSPHIGHO2_12_FULL_36_11]OGK43368.1 MAG: hypothetical protein A3B40_01060 [Candidatus Roizmanbacteria bacterium RIFCSPLOWO2_01_FULL_37_16]
MFKGSLPMPKIFKFLQNKALQIEKRFRFVISALLLSLLMLISTFFLFEKSGIFIIIFFLSCFILTYFSLLEGIENIEWFTHFFMPVVLTISFYLFYFLFPVRWLTRLPFIFLYAVSIYAVLLCSNIFNVGVEKSLQLYRAAFSINFFYQTVVSFLIYNTLFSFKLNFIFNFIVIMIITFLLSLQLIWTVKLDLPLNKNTLLFSLLTALILAQLALLGSFVPLKSTILSLFLTSSYYCLSGLIYNFLDERLFKETIREYVFVWITVLLITILSISW